MRLHRALADPSRVRILEVLREAASLDARQLAARVGLHANTVRSHLRILGDANLVSAKTETRTHPGRPRIVYELGPEGAPASEEPGGYRLLAEILASHLAGSEADCAARAEQAGRVWGRHLVDRPAPFAAFTTGEAIQKVVVMLEDFGFQPRLESAPGGHAILMERCPFGEVAQEYRRIVCPVHLGLMQGALAELGADVEADSLQPNVEPGLCVAHLAEAAGD